MFDLSVFVLCRQYEKHFASVCLQRATVKAYVQVSHPIRDESREFLIWLNRYERPKNVPKKSRKITLTTPLVLDSSLPIKVKFSVFILLDKTSFIACATDPECVSRILVDQLTRYILSCLRW